MYLIGKIVLLHIFIGSKENCQEMKVFRLRAAKGHSSYSKFGATQWTPQNTNLWQFLSLENNFIYRKKAIFNEYQMNGGHGYHVC